jgi:TBCC domain-containing protein 1
MTEQQHTSDNRHHLAIWCRAEVFTFGALTTPPPPDITSASLKSIVKYMKKSSTAGYPKMNYMLWRHIACSKLHMSEELAWMYFETYSMLTNVSNQRRIQTDIQMAKANSTAEIERLKDSRKVDSLAFILLLFLQSFHQIDLKSTLSRDEWPNRKRNSDIDARKNRIYDEQSHQLFIQAHLDDLLNIISETSESSNNESVQSATLSMDAVIALSYIFEGTLHDNLRKIVPLHAIIQNSTIQHEIGVNKSIVPFKNLSNLIRRSLIANPFQVGQTMKRGTLLPLPFNNPTHEQRSGRVLCNSNFADEAHRFVLMTMINRSLSDQQSTEITNAEFRIHRCSYSYIYILSPLRCVEVRKCHNVTIVLGAIETTLKVTDCENVSISAVCRRLLISQCRSSSFYIHTPTRPLIQLNCANLLFAPYNASHVELLEQMEGAGLCKELNLWNKPLVTHPAGYVDEQPWLLLPPDDFYPISSIRLEDQQTDGLLPLPTEYQSAMDKRQKSITTLANEITAAQLNPDQRQRFQRFVVSNFEAWLDATGNAKILNHLSSLQQQ